MTFQQKVQDNITPLLIISVFVIICLVSLGIFGPVLHAELVNQDSIEKNAYEVLTLEEVTEEPADIDHTERDVSDERDEILGEAVDGDYVYVDSSIPDTFSNGEIYRHGEDYYEIRVEERQSTVYPVIGEIRGGVAPILTVITATVLSALIATILGLYYLISAFVFEHNWEFRESDMVFYSLTVSVVLTAVCVTIVFY